MAPERKTRRSTLASDSRDTEEPEPPDINGAKSTDAPEGPPNGCTLAQEPEHPMSEPALLDAEPAPNAEPAHNIETSLQMSEETAREVWESMREEFYEQIEQLPLSLHRSFALISEQDKEVQSCQAELLPAIRSYAKLRQAIRIKEQCSAEQNPRDGDHTPATNLSVKDAMFRDEENITMLHQKEELNSSMDVDGVEVVDGLVGLQSPTKFPPSSKSHPSNQNSFTKARPQSLRETDATVPKSVPFPPRPKPKTTRELLTRIAYLLAELIRASEEKVGLATAVYDSVDRHVRALDATIGEQEVPTMLGLIDEVPTLAQTPQVEEDVIVHEIDVEDDEEPQLGMVGPADHSGGNTTPYLRKHKKGDKRDPRKHIVDEQPPPRVQTSNATMGVSQEIPVDPHEPRYCYCNQVSYGEMIGCDNPDCIREWFHLGCAGLAAPPKGKVKWYCRDCEELLGRNRKKRVQ